MLHNQYFCEKPCVIWIWIRDLSYTKVTRGKPNNASEMKAMLGWTPGKYESSCIFYMLYCRFCIFSETIARIAPWVIQLLTQISGISYLLTNLSEISQNSLLDFFKEKKEIKAFHTCLSVKASMSMFLYYGFFFFFSSWWMEWIIGWKSPNVDKLGILAIR